MLSVFRETDLCAEYRDITDQRTWKGDRKSNGKKRIHVCPENLNLQ